MILAPVAREKKGEFLDVFAEMQAQGYVRFRVNGKTCEFDDLPALKKTEKHDIDVVIDRIKVRAAPVQAQPSEDHAASVAARTDYGQTPRRVTSRVEYTVCDACAVLHGAVSKGFSRCQVLCNAVFFPILFKETRGGQTQTDSGLCL